MDRRSALKTVSILMGGALASGTVASVLTGCNPQENSSDWTARTFDDKQLATLADIVETIMPTTDTPGAKALNVHQYIDSSLADNFSAEDRKAIVALVDEISAAAQDAHGKAFSKLSGEEQLAIVAEFDKRAFSADAPKPNTFRTLKSLTVGGYFLTEVGQTQVLQHVAVPGAYNGCVPLAEAGEGRTWAQ